MRGNETRNLRNQKYVLQKLVQISGTATFEPDSTISNYSRRGFCFFPLSNSACRPLVAGIEADQAAKKLLGKITQWHRRDIIGRLYNEYKYRLDTSLRRPCAVAVSVERA